MKFARKLTAVCLLAIAGALWPGVTFAVATEILIAAPPAPPPSLGERLWQSYTNHIRGRMSDESFTNSFTRWNTNGLLWGLSNSTGIGNIGIAGNAAGTGLLVVNCAITRRHIYIRGHDNGSSNAAVDTHHSTMTRYVYLTASNTPVYVNFLASFRRHTNGFDYCLLLASNDLPTSITPLRMADYSGLQLKSWLAFTWPRFNPWLGVCQHSRCGIAYVTSTGHSTWQGGDSGSTDFYILDGWAYMTSGRSTSGYSSQMQADADALTTWAGLNPANYQIETLDLSQFQ